MHALVLANDGICCLSPASYRYLVTGDLSATIDFVTVEDVANPVIKEYIEKVELYLYLIKILHSLKTFCKILLRLQR